MRSHISKGFTLIELVVVIVILGILAATAAPKFMDLQKDARISKLNGIKGAIRSAENMTVSKAVLAGLEKKEGTKTSLTYVCETGSALETCNSSTGISISFGYPAVFGNGILKALDIDAVQADESDAKQHDWAYRIREWDDKKAQLLIGPADMPIPAEYNTGSPAEGCYVFYDHPHLKDDGSLVRQVVVVTTGC
ncbi:type II secretion system protein [Succinimonas sp.]|uniref:type II secretion system protein n=1 Tax=Succinimonas sp. TaxID=1936151 RepID=UPI0038677C6A